MSFERSRVQLKCENILSCTGDLEKWKKSKFEELVLTKDYAEEMKSLLLEDSLDLYFKGLLSLFESINSINRLLFSWATIKAYYAVFYFIKCTLSIKGYALIRKKGLYILKIGEGERPRKNGNRKYNSDHEGTINYYQDIFKNSDKLLSNNIGEDTSYIWLMKKREQINYRERHFNEPGCSVFWEYIFEKVKKRKLNEIIENYAKDNFIYCFQENHASLAIPIKRSLLTKDDLNIENLNDRLPSEKIEVLKNLLIPNLDNISLLSKLCK